MEIIALANQKGGVAKTTSTYNLAYQKAREGKQVLMVDLDPQASLTILCGIMPGKEPYSICDLFDLKTDPFDCGYQVETVDVDTLYIVPSDIELAVTEQNLSGRTAREKILKKQLDKFDGQFDYIFIDCPPQLGILTTNGLVAANKVIIPTKAEYLSYRGIRALKETIRTVQDEFNPDLSLEGFIITMYERIVNDQRDMVEQFKKEAPILGMVKKSADAYRSVLDGTPVVMSNKKSDVAQAYMEIAAKI
jgi:chromosome partitioning protein